ncbi:hypothetical protein PRUB_b0546 [Pseudoalteromonas rubra]|uniref:Uncharacterized protein n=1 Tax=Pseudoalteromonas rubra TaxID=43658 RepID=A0A8T0C066_9GAMM|nr:hypothetical protein PRUB_b0546 [Pseudoalteromonas rubra]
MIKTLILTVCQRATILSPCCYLGLFVEGTTFNSILHAKAMLFV